MPNFIKIGGTRTDRQRNMVKYTPRVLFIFLQDISWEALPKKNTQQFQALNGLKCSTAVT